MGVVFRQPSQRLLAATKELDRDEQKNLCRDYINVPNLLHDLKKYLLWLTVRLSVV